MENEFIPYIEALALKELGFNKECFGYYTGDKMHLVIRPAMSRTNIPDSYVVTAPLYQQAFRWFTEKYGLWSMIYPRDGWNYSINRVDETTSCSGESFHSVEINKYEEAELECLKKLIEIVKNKHC
jgi:hypothetical protein